MTQRKYVRIRYVDVVQMKDRIHELQQQLAQMDQSRRLEIEEGRRYEKLLDARWDEMQRLRDLIYAISTHTAPRSVVEREIQRIGGAMTPAEHKERPT